jgi:hypothetical protein
MTIRKALAATVLGVAFLAVTAVPNASAAPWGARVVVRPYPYWGFGYYSYAPGWYYPGRYVYVPAGPTTGDVKIDTHMKGGSILVDGGYAGETTKLKKFALQPGNHEVEVRDAAGNTIYRERVQVLVGKTTEIKLG